MLHIILHISFRLTELLCLPQVLSSLGYHVVTFDYRGEGNDFIRTFYLQLLMQLLQLDDLFLCRLGGFRRVSVRAVDDRRRSLHVRLVERAAGKEASLHLGTLSGDGVFPPTFICVLF